MNVFFKTLEDLASKVLLNHFYTEQQLNCTCFSVCFRIHDDKLRPQLADPTSFEDGHQPPKVFQVQCVTGTPDLWVILRPLHGAVQPLIPSCWVADKISHIVWVWDWRLHSKAEGKRKFSSIGWGSFLW